MRRIGGSRSVPPPAVRNSPPIVSAVAALTDDDQDASRTATQLCNEVEDRIIQDIRQPGSDNLGPLTEAGRSQSETQTYTGDREGDGKRARRGDGGSFEFCLSGELLEWKSATEAELVAAARVDRVLPNLRDLSVSSCHEGMKKGLLYRSARLFSSALCEVSEVLLKILQVQLVLDLRDENLTAIQEELNSRLVVSRFYRPCLLTSQRDRDAQTKDAPFLAQRRSPTETPAGIRNQVRSITAQALTELEIAHATANKPSRIDLLKKMTQQAEQLRKARPDLPELIIRSLAVDPASQALCRMFSKNEDRKLAIVNILDTPAVKRRVLETVSNSPYLPLVVLARAADKLTGTALAPFYFCKYVMSTRNILESYIEMLESCGANFGLALKVIALSRGPVLFHCTLGKDRTGVLAMLLLYILGASESAIIFDYTLTERATTVFQEYNHKFIVKYSGLSEQFCSSGAETMRQTMDYIRSRWGCVWKYLDEIGVDLTWRKVIRDFYLHQDAVAKADRELDPTP